MYQKVVLVGRLGRDPELRFAPSGAPVCSFPIAVNERRGERDVTTWLRVTAWRKLGETCAQYLSKGRLVLVEGRLTPGDDGHPRVWSGNDGQPRASFELEAFAVKFLDGGQQQSAEVRPYVQGEFAGAGQRPYGPGGGEPPDEGPEDESEFPF